MIIGQETPQVIPTSVKIPVGVIGAILRVASWNYLIDLTVAVNILKYNLIEFYAIWYFLCLIKSLRLLSGLKPAKNIEKH